MERISLRKSSQWNKSVNAITILVVDDDTTCLSIVAAILKKFRYEVVTVKHPNDALCTLRIKEFDLVVSDVHMPDMNGFELQQVIAQEFNLPVVLMSADDEEGVALKGLERGAAFFILKPVSPDDVRDLWQFASMKKTTSNQVVIEETESTFPEKNISGESATKRKSPQKDEKGRDNSQSASTKKPKVIWTNSLHNRFLEAIRSIGLDRAVPKKILEVMNVPGLTRENVASHLQKYRIFLRRVSDASYKIQHCADNGLSRKLMRPSCESSSPPITLSSSLNHNPNLETYPQSGFGQSRLLSNRGWSWPPPNTGIHQNYERLCARSLAQNVYHSGPLATNTTTYDHEIPSQNPDVISSSTYVGYSLSSIQNLTTSDKFEELPSSDGLLGDMISNGQQLCDAIEDYGIALDSNIDHLHFPSSFTPIFDLSELDIISNAHELGAGYDQLNIQNHPQQNNGTETSTNSNFYGDLTHWDNPVLSFNQSQNQNQSSQGLMSSQGFGNSSHLNKIVVQPINKQPQVYRELTSSQAFGTSSQLSKTVLPLTERDDDEFLESLLAPFGEDQTLVGLI